MEEGFLYLMTSLTWPLNWQSLIFGQQFLNMAEVSLDYVL